ncbi:MAG: MarR family transcriptional regulator [Proteobacteria bacterium]|nr:MarR family transcriptional regulator [Pseudomonadota bacterium]
MEKVIIGIMPQKEIRARIDAIASGHHKILRDEPKIWFTSIRSVAEVLSDDNQTLLQIIIEKKPQSIQELAKITGRHSSNLSRTLKTLANYGFIELEKIKKAIHPIVKFNQFSVVFSIGKR